LKDALKIRNSPSNIEENFVDSVPLDDPMKNFIEALKEGKKNLNSITPPKRKIIV